MKKTLVLIFLIGALLVCAAVAYKYRGYIKRMVAAKKINTIVQNKEEPVLAVFSFNADFQNKLINSVPHFTAKIYSDASWKSQIAAIDQFSDDTPIFVTIETWSVNRFSSPFHHPLDELLNGKYDKIIEDLCIGLIGKGKNIYVRINPDMEVPVQRFPWQYYGPRYIDAYRYFAKLCKTFAPEAKLMWGPAGYPGSMEFYPGDDVVDAASVTLKSDSEQSLDVYPKNYPVQYDLMRRLHRLRFIDKPIFVFGSTQIANDSVDAQMVAQISDIINNERNVIYSYENFNRFTKPVKRIEKGEFEIGLYDPQSLLNKEELVTVEHLFADFGNLNDGTFQSRFREVLERRHKLIVTFEPFRIPQNDRDEKILQHIIEGKYDKELESFFNLLSSTNTKIYLRFAHEMEIPISRYPWQSKNPVDYIHSFRYFMKFKNPWPENIKRVWGPAGDRGSIEWYPGNDVVDYLSIAIYGLPDKNITDAEKQESFSTIFNRKYWRLRFLNKPLFITEFGVKGPDAYQTKWLTDAAKTIRNNSQIVGINYFNMSDTPMAWGDIKPPDWSISRESFNAFLATLLEDE